MSDEPYDWADDADLDAEETLRRFELLEPVDVTGYHRLGCEHVSAATGGATRLLSFEAFCGCHMQPIYATS